MSTLTDAVAAYSAAVTAGVAMVAAYIALRQLISGRQETRLGVAKTIYKDYLALAIANPELSSAGYPTNDPPSLKFKKNDPLKYEKYEYYVAYLLYAAEEIICLTKGKDKWRATLIDQLRFHGAYLGSSDFPEGHYSSELVELVEAALEEYREHCE
jgi:hypothetical protein